MKVPALPKKMLHKGEELHWLRQTDRKTWTSFLERESKRTSHRELQIGRMHWKRKQEIKNCYIGVSPTFLKSKGDVSASTNKSKIKT